MQGQAPQMMPPQAMAAYGMQLGGYDMPFVMANGGLLRAQNGIETVEDREAKKVTEFTPGGREGVTDQSGFESRTFETPGAEKGSAKYYTGRGNATEESVASGICKKIRESNNLEEMILGAFPAYLGGKRPGDEGYDKALDSAIAKLKANPLYTKCIQEVQDATAPTIRDEYIVPETGQQEEVCFCKDREGNKIPGTEMTPAQIEADGKIEGYTADQGCVSEFINAYCQEEVTEVKRQEAMQEREDVSLPAIPISSMRLGVADPEKATLAPLMAGERNYLDYRTAVQNLQSASDIQKQGIMNAAGLTFGQKLAAMAKVDAEIAPRIASTVTDVYNKNVATANELAKTEEARDTQYNLARANIDQQYNRDLQLAENQRTVNVNANRQRYDAYRQDIAKQKFMENLIGSENFDAFGNFTKARDLVPFSSLAECLANNPGKQAECFAAFGQNQQNTNQQNTTPDQQDQVARFGGKLLPYVYGNSVYPF